MNVTFDPQFEVPGGPVLIRGECTRFDVKDPAMPSPPGVGNLVLDPSKPFRIEVDWQIDGILAPLWLTALGGDWRVETYAESIGPGPEVRIGQTSVPVASPGAAVPVKYQAVINVGAGASNLVEHSVNGPSGTYKLVTTIFLNSSIPGPIGYDVCGFCEGPIIKVENPI